MDDLQSDQLLFGKKGDTKRLWLYSRYAAGDPVSVIAADAGISAEQVYVVMRECPADYEQTKKLREDFLKLRVRRQLSLVDAYNLRLLEDLSESKLIPTDETIKLLSKLSKELSHRNQLYEDKPTEIIRDEAESLTIDEMKNRITQAENAGGGLDTGSIGEEQ